MDESKSDQAEIADQHLAFREKYLDERLPDDLAGACVPQRLIARLASGEWEETKAVEAILAALREQKKLVALSGPPGCGKTMAACVAMRHAIRKMSMSCLFLSAWVRTRTSVYDEMADTWASMPLLVIDDIGEEYADVKGFSASVLDQLITERYDNNVITVITTNLTAARFKERCGERIADRIREVGAFIELAEDSMRKKSDA